MAPHALADPPTELWKGPAETTFDRDRTRLLAFRATDVAFVVPRAERIYPASSAAPVRDLRPEGRWTR